MTRFLHVIHLLKKSKCLLAISQHKSHRILIMVPDCRITIDTLFCGMDPLRLWKLSLERRVIKRPMQMFGLSDVRGEKFEHEIRNRHRIAAVVDFCISCFFSKGYF